MSFNIYEELPSNRTVDEMAAEMDFPVVIGEFHFGALDRGMFDPGLRRTKDQSERAEKYAAYIREAAAAPWCVGAHWFQYLDQSLTGRPDGENYNIGFVDATDDPYPELRAAARRIHGKLYHVRYGRVD
jgi:agarase